MTTQHLGDDHLERVATRLLSRCDYKIGAVAKPRVLVEDIAAVLWDFFWPFPICCGKLPTRRPGQLAKPIWSETSLSGSHLGADDKAATGRCPLRLY